MATETVMATVYITAASPSPPAPLLPHCPKMPLHQGGNQKKGGSLYSRNHIEEKSITALPQQQLLLPHCPRMLLPHAIPHI